MTVYKTPEYNSPAPGFIPLFFIVFFVCIAVSVRSTRFTLNSDVKTTIQTGSVKCVRTIDYVSESDTSAMETHKGWKIVSTISGDEFNRDLKRIVLSRNTLGTFHGSDSTVVNFYEFSPTLVVTFKRLESQIVDVEFDFNRNVVRYDWGGGEEYFDFTKNRNNILALYKRMFPKDTIAEEYIKENFKR